MVGVAYFYLCELEGMRGVVGFVGRSLVGGMLAVVVVVVAGCGVVERRGLKWWGEGRDLSDRCLILMERGGSGRVAGLVAVEGNRHRSERVGCVVGLRRGVENRGFEEYRRVGPEMVAEIVAVVGLTEKLVRIPDFDLLVERDCSGMVAAAGLVQELVFDLFVGNLEVRIAV